MLSLIILIFICVIAYVIMGLNVEKLIMAVFNSELSNPFIVKWMIVLLWPAIILTMPIIKGKN